MSETKIVKFRINEKPLFAKKIDVNETLFQIRKKCGNKFPSESLFTCSDGTKIEVEDENDFTLKDIADNEDKALIIYLNKKEENIQQNNNGIDKPKSNAAFIDQNDQKNVHQSQNGKSEPSNENTEESLSSSKERDYHYYDGMPKRKVNFLNQDIDKSGVNNRYEMINKKNNEYNNENNSLEQNKQEEIPYWLKDENDNDEPINQNNSNSNYEENKYDSNIPYSCLKIKEYEYITNKKEISKNNNDKYYNEMPPPVANKLNKGNSQNNSKICSKFSKKDLSKFKCIGKNGNLSIYLYPSCNFTNAEEIKAITFMVVGETGCGKTTLLNSFVNSLLGVELNDNYRFKIIEENFARSQAFSQTNEVNYYNIRSVGGYPPVKIIDTPGYGDTRGIERDKEITSQIKELFHTKINTLNAICFVCKSSNNRLTHSQRYILSSILDLFGEDVKEIFVFMLTFCDGGKPNVIEPLKEKNCPFRKVIELFENNSWYYKFNNSAIFEDNRNDEFTRMFWKLGMKNFEEFKKNIKTFPRKSLQLSRKVLDQRKLLEDKVQILNDKLRVGLNKIEEIKGIIEMLLRLKGNLNDCKNFTKTIMQPTIKKVPKDPNYYATTCITCTKTCHKHCKIADDDDKERCAAMDKNGNCFYCPKKCHWDVHKNRDYILEDVMEPKTITLEDLKKRYYNSKDQLSVKKQLFLGAREDLIKLNLECLDTQEDITNSINLLHQIALNKSVFESAEEHIDLLIEVEISEHKPGWQNRVHGLKILKDEKRMLREVYQGKNKSLIKIREFVENEVNKYIEMDIDKLDEVSNTNKCLIF